MKDNECQLRLRLADSGNFGVVEIRGRWKTFPTGPRRCSNADPSRGHV